LLLNCGIFSPLVLITLLIYLIAIVATEKTPTTIVISYDFNIMLLGVMGIIVTPFPKHPK